MPPDPVTDPVADPAKPLAAPTAPSPSPTLPSLAETALDGPLTEQTAALSKKLKERETELASLQDENRRLKTQPEMTAKQKKHWLDGGTFFDADDD